MDFYEVGLQYNGLRGNHWKLFRLMLLTYGKLHSPDSNEKPVKTESLQKTFPHCDQRKHWGKDFFVLDGCGLVMDSGNSFHIKSS